MFASTEALVVEVVEVLSERSRISHSLAVQCTHLRPLERDRRTFRVVLVVDVRHFGSYDDVVELSGERQNLFLCPLQLGNEGGTDRSSLAIGEPLNRWHAFSEVVSEHDSEEHRDGKNSESTHHQEQVG